MEAAVAYADATGKTTFLSCMEKYANYIYRVFVEERSAAFMTPGHQEIELALVRMYRFTGKEKYLKLAQFFLDQRACPEDQDNGAYDQSHLPVREQTEVVGHAVRALYMYVGMAYLAAHTGEQTMIDTCKTLWRDLVDHKMYVTGGMGSTRIGEAFTTAYDLPNDTSYAETCAGIALMLFGNAMLALDNNAEYADVVERVFYNGVLSGLSLEGTSFFYENALEINLNEHFDSATLSSVINRGKRHFPITQRPSLFSISCCPPNLNRLLPSLGNYIYGRDGDTLYVNQYAASKLCDGDVECVQHTDYPRDGRISVRARGVARIALRIPAWCDRFELNKPYVIQNGYAMVENDGEEIVLSLDLTPRAVWADTRVLRDVGKICVMRGPVVYCAESVDNGANLHSILVPSDFSARELESKAFGLPTLEIECERRLPFCGRLYSNQPPRSEKCVLKLIPYHAFANRGESDMLVWLHAK